MDPIVDTTKKIVQPTPDGENAEQDTPEVDSTTDFVERAEYEKVKRESINRKKRLKELEAKMAELEGATKEKQSLDSDLQTYKKILAEKDSEILRLKHMGNVREQITKLGALDQRVAELAYMDAVKEDVLDSPDELNSFLNEWKRSNSSFFKPDKPQISTPRIPDSSKVEEPLSPSTDEAKWDAFKNMDRASRNKLSEKEFQDYMNIGKKLAGASFRQSMK